MAEPIYQIRHLQHGYQDLPVLEIEGFSIDSKTIVGVIGPNGSGKSTLLKLLAFVEKPGQGKIFFKGRPAEPFSDHVRFQVSLLTQEPYLMQRTVYSNIAYGLRLRGKNNHVRQQVIQALEWVGLSGEAFIHRRWYALSGGEAQRVALAARLALKPAVLLLDEPTASVDAVSAQLIKDAALRAKRLWGTTLVIASHDWSWLYEICDEVRHLFRGQFVETGGENLLFGPWQSRGDGYWEKTLPDGQSLRVTPPPDSEAVAVIPADAISLVTVKPVPDAAQSMLRGTISRMIHDRRTGDIVTTILAENLPFTVKISRERLRRLDLHPGLPVLIVYAPERVKWFT